MIDYDATDPTFVQDLKDSQESVWKAAQWLSGCGYNVTVRALSIRPDAEQMAEYADQGDLEIIQRVEVKRRPDIDFTSAEDFPFATLIVDVAHAYDRAKPKPYAYIIFDADASHCAIVKSLTRPSWVRTERMDRKKGRMRTFYECPTDLCKWLAL